MLRVANNVEDCEEKGDCYCEGQGCISIDPLDESVDDEPLEQFEGEGEDQLEAEEH